MAFPIDDLKKRREKAKTIRQQFQPLLDECYDYAIPYRRAAGAYNAQGERRVDRLFDQTSVQSTFRGAGRLQQDLWPPGEDAYQLEPGPLLEASDPKTAAQLRPQLEALTKITSAAFTDGSWDQAFLEMALDLYASTGVMFLPEHEDVDRILRFVTVPLDEVMLMPGPYGDVWEIYWCRKWRLDAIATTWPAATFVKELADKLKSEPGTEIDLNQDTLWDAKAKVWIHTVWSESNKKTPFAVTKHKTCPWLTPRYYRVPGETYGRGPVMLAMPTVKTLNTAQMLTLQAAAIAMLGIYTAVDDGVFNPDLASLDPGAIWKVARNGGALGLDLRFPDPRIDLTNIVIKELQMQVQGALVDQQLPPDGAAVRSATEIMERVKRLASDHIGAFGRLVNEIIIPVVRRVIEIAHKKGLIPGNTSIDQLLVRIKVTSPMAVAREAGRVQRIVQWLQLVLTMMPQGAQYVAKIEDALAEIGRAMGVSERFIVGDDERAQMKKTDQDTAMASMAAQAALANGGGKQGTPADAPQPAPAPEALV